MPFIDAFWIGFGLVMGAAIGLLVVVFLIGCLREYTK